MTSYLKIVIELFSGDYADDDQVVAGEREIFHVFTTCFFSLKLCEGQSC